MRTRHLLRHPLLLALCSAVVTFFVTRPAPVAAVVTHYISASACVLHGTVTTPDTFQSALGNADSVTREVYCPILDGTGAPDGTFAKDGISVLTVYYDDENPNMGADVTAQACVTYLTAGTGGSCGTAATSLSGARSMSVMTTPWTAGNATAFGYLYVTLPPVKAMASTLRGYTLTKL